MFKKLFEFLFPVPKDIPAWAMLMGRHVQYCLNKRERQEIKGQLLHVEFPMDKGWGDVGERKQSSKTKYI